MTTATITAPTRRPTRLAATLLAAGALAAASFQLGSRSADVPPFRVDRIEFASVADFSDDRRLVGFAENVFFGEVLAQEKTDETKQPVPQTDFRVRVTDTIKGSLRGDVTVTQEGGYVSSRNELRLMDGDALLEPGHVYLFATRPDPAGRQFVVPEFGDVQVRSAAHRDELRTRFTRAKGQEIRFTPQG